MSRRVPEGWREVRLDEIAAVNPRPQPLQPDSVVSFVAMADVSEQGYIISFSGRTSEELQVGLPQFQRNDTLVAKITPCFENGKGALVDGLPHRYGVGSTEFHVIRSNGLANPSFLYWLTRSTSFRRLGEQNMTGSAGQRRVPTEFLKSFSIPLPPLPEQEKIAEILGSIDAAIMATRRVIEHTRNLKRALMQELLTRGIPGRHTRFKDSPLGRIPGDWDAMKLADVGTIKAGFTINQARHPTLNPRPYLRVANVQAGYFDLSEIAYLDAAEQEFEDRHVDVGDVLIVEGHANIRELGRACVADIRVAGMTHQNHIHRFVPDRSMVDPTFVAIALGTDAARRLIEPAGGTSSGLHTLSRSNLSLIAVPVPPLTEQTEIVAALDSCEGRIANERSASSIQQNIKNAVMSALLSGEVRVPLAATEAKSVVA